MANDDVIGPRKTMFILVIVVGCFAVLWPRILSPLVLGPSRQQLQPNQFDRDAGCCEVMFGSELAVLELINEVCSSVVHIDGKISPYAASECRKAVNETCGVDIAAFLKRTENVGKTSKLLVQTMQSSNSLCLKEHFGVPVLSLGPHLAFNSLTLPDTMKQERAPIRGGGPHPALRERGRAIPSAPVPAKSSQTQMPPHVRPPPIPGMRPPLGSPGGPQSAPKSSMGLLLPIYTLCIIVFTVYTLSKIFFKRATVQYEDVTPDPVFRRKVFRDDSRSTPDKLVVSAISGLVAEVRQQMETTYQQNQQTQERQDNHTRPYTNGTVLHNTGPVHIVASEYQKDKSPEPKEASPDPKEASPEPKEASPEPKEASPEPKKAYPEPKEASPEPIEASPKPKQASPEPKEASPEPKLKSALEEVIEEKLEKESDVKEAVKELLEEAKDIEVEVEEIEEKVTEDLEPVKDITKELIKNKDLVDLTEPASIKKNGDILSKVTEDFIEEAKKAEEQKTKELLEEALDDEDEEEEESEEEPEEPEKSSVKVLGMELRAESADGTAFPPPNDATPQSHAHHAPPPPPVAPRTPHEAEEVKSIFLDTEIPQKSRVLVDFADDVRDQTPPAKHSPTVVSGKMTLSLIQDAPRETPERDPESTVDDFTTASALTQDVAEKEGSESEEEVEEEIEIEEIEEEVEEEEIEEDEEEKPQPVKKGTE